MTLLETAPPPLYHRPLSDPACTHPMPGSGQVGRKRSYTSTQEVAQAHPLGLFPGSWRNLTLTGQSSSERGPAGEPRAVMPAHFTPAFERRSWPALSFQPGKAFQPRTVRFHEAGPSEARAQKRPETQTLAAPQWTWRFQLPTHFPQRKGH